MLREFHTVDIALISAVVIIVLVAAAATPSVSDLVVKMWEHAISTQNKVQLTTNLLIEMQALP